MLGRRGEEHTPGVRDYSGCRLSNSYVLSSRFGPALIDDTQRSWGVGAQSPTFSPPPPSLPPSGALPPNRDESEHEDIKDRAVPDRKHVYIENLMDEVVNFIPSGSASSSSSSSVPASSSSSHENLSADDRLDHLPTRKKRKTS